MAIIDNRRFITELEKTGDVVRVGKEVDWDCEAGAIVRRLCETEGPAALFENIRDYPGHRILGAPLATFRRAAVAMGLPVDTPVREICWEFERRLKSPINPTIVANAPCQENLLLGDAVDLTLFPAPMVHDGDGGRYIASWRAIITKDPETNEYNWGMYRQMIHDEKHLGGLMLPGSGGGRHRAKWEARGQPMPFATVIGADPCSMMAACTPLPPEIPTTEAQLTGGLLGQPVELVGAKTVDLEVPAHAEIVIEGYLVPDALVEEGPFGEFTGYRSSPRVPRGLFRVTAITWRNNPILTMSNMGIPQDDSHVVTAALGARAVIKDRLERMGVPIVDVYVPPEGVSNLVIVSTRKPYEHVADNIVYAMSASPYLTIYGLVTIVVDEDVDPYDWKQVVHAIASKCHPLKGVRTFPSIGNPLTPSLSLEERKWGRGGKMLLDCLWPLDWDPETEKPVKSSFKAIYPPALQEQVLGNWQEYGFE